jgi:tetratricopeptide (TPR) repeat protein
LLDQVGDAYECAGFPDKAKQCFQDRFKLTGDSLDYYNGLSGIEEDLNKILDLQKKGYAIDSTNFVILGDLANTYELLGQYKESLKYFKKWIERLKPTGINPVAAFQRLEYVYWQNGYKDQAEYYSNEQLKYCIKSIELKRSWGEKLYSYYDLAGVYAFKGEKDKAYKNLRIFNQIQRVPLWMAHYIKIDPLFNNIRNEPEFQQIAKDIESKYQAEHERVKKWLEENKML